MRRERDTTRLDDETSTSRGERPSENRTADATLGSGPSLSTLPSPQSAGGSFIVDRAGNILAFDNDMERLTGWQAAEIVGHKRDFGFYAQPDELGLRRFERRALYKGRLPLPETTTRAKLDVYTKGGGYYEAEVIVTPLGPGRARFLIEVQRILSRVAAPVASASEEGRDPLTRLAGPEIFKERLEQEFQAADAGGRPMSILLLNIDDFAGLIEREGRYQAREVLRRLGGVIQALIRQDDLVARIKEDGFGIVLSGAGRSEARHAGGRIRSTIEQFGFARPGRQSDLRVTVSIGIACYPADGDTPAEMVRRCGEALQEACRLGHNRVWCYARRPRVRAEIPVYFDGPAAHLLGRARDLSNSGIFIETQEDLRVGMRLGLMFNLPGETHPVRCVGRIARRVPPDIEGATRPPGIGIEFERYSEIDRQRIDSHIHAVQGDGGRGGLARGSARPS